MERHHVVGWRPHPPEPLPRRNPANRTIGETTCASHIQGGFPTSSRGSEPPTSKERSHRERTGEGHGNAGVESRGLVRLLTAGRLDLRRPSQSQRRHSPTKTGVMTPLWPKMALICWLNAVCHPLIARALGTVSHPDGLA